jgi:Family of unknown function (DUF5719)
LRFLGAVRDQWRQIVRKSILASVIALAVAVLLVSLARPDVSAPASSGASYALSASARSCPYTHAAAGRTSFVAMASVPAAVQASAANAQPATGPSSAKLSTIGAKTTRLLTVTGLQQMAAKWTATAAQPASLAIGSGTLAAGLAATTWTLQPGGRARGLMSTDCIQPRADYWFVGSGSSVGRTSQLILSNPDPTPAQTTVSLVGDSGPIVAPTLMGLSVPGYSEQTINLTSLAPAAAHLVTHVRVDSGHLAAWVTDTQSVGLYALGTDYVPPAANASTNVVLPGLSDGLSARELLLYVPGALGAQVTVHVVSTSGSFVPNGMSFMPVAPGKAVALSMSNVSMPPGSSLVLTSTLPVFAAEHSELSRPGTLPTDSVYAASATPIEQAATTTAILTSGQWQSRVVLIAPTTAATVDLYVWTSPTVLRRIGIAVPAGGSHAYAVPELGQARTVSIAVVPRPGSGPVYGSIGMFETVTSGPFGSVRPLVSTPLTVSMPVVVSDPRTALNTSGG